MFARTIRDASVHGCRRLGGARGLRGRALSAGPASSQTAELMRWLKEGGAKIDGAEFAQTADRGWELVASRNLCMGDVIIELPASLQLCAPPASPEGLGALGSKVPPTMWAVRLGLALLAEVGLSRTPGVSHWQPYLDVLPKTYSVPLFFSRDEIIALQSPRVISQAGMRSRFVLDFARQHLSASSAPLFHGSLPDAGGLAWAAACSSSRAFLLGEAGEVPRLLPGIDMCNHSFEPSCVVSRRLMTGEAMLKAARDVTRGKPLEISYGSLCNDTLLLDYGFVPSEANPFDFVSVPFTTQLIATAREVVGLGDAPFGDATAGALSDVPDGSTPLARWQEGALEHLGLAEGAGGAVGGAGWGKVVGAVRVVCAGDPGEIGLGVLAEGGYDYAGCEALNGRLGGRGGRGEVEVLKTLLGMTVCGMMQFQTGMQEDEELLSRGGLGGNMRLCLEYRLRKKLGVKRVADDVKLQLQAASSSRGGS